MATAVELGLNMSILTEYNIVGVVDTSSSMLETDMPGGQTRWAYMQESLLGFVRDVEPIDEDGIDLVMFGGTRINSYTSVTSTRAKEIFAETNPRGSTPLTEALIESLELVRRSSKKAIIVVFTDGIPNDKKSVETVIVNAANSIETDDQLTFLFIQVGYDKAAGAWLKQLDDDLKGNDKAKFDIVDVKTQAEADGFPSTTAMLLNAIVD